MIQSKTAKTQVWSFWMRSATNYCFVSFWNTAKVSLNKLPFFLAACLCGSTVITIYIDLKNSMCLMNYWGLTRRDFIAETWPLYTLCSRKKRETLWWPSLLISSHKLNPVTCMFFDSGVFSVSPRMSARTQKYNPVVCFTGADASLMQRGPPCR